MSGMDENLEAAARQISSFEASGSRVEVQSFFDEATHTATHVVHDPLTGKGAVIDSVLDYDSAAGRTSTQSAKSVMDYLDAQNITLEWVLETHAHADHFSAAPLFKSRYGGEMGIGRGILIVQNAFGKIFNYGTEFARDGSEFDRLFDDGDCFSIGTLPVTALHVPGHTPADMAYVVGDVVFTGDTLFMPDYGTARADFPGGDARQLYRSIRRLLALPEQTRLFLCHDYKTEDRTEYRWETTVARERAENVHVHDGVSEDMFVQMRNARDAALDMPRLILPAVQVNMRAGNLPTPEDNGVRYLKLPIDTF